jgi:hypothetical protein
VTGGEQLSDASGRKGSEEIEKEPGRIHRFQLSKESDLEALMSAADLSRGPSGRDGANVGFLKLSGSMSRAILEFIAAESGIDRAPLT